MKFRRRPRLPDATPFRVRGLSLWLLAMFASPFLSVTTAAQDASFDYLYIESNEGGSSGGHTAIRFGEDVYHFQAEDGMLVLRRDAAKEFLYSYALLGNRTIHSTRIAVSGETRSVLLDRFRERHRAQEAQIAVRKSLRADRRFFEVLRDHENDPKSASRAPRLSVLGLGYFTQPPLGEMDPIETPTARSRSSTLRSLRESIGRTHGRDFLSTRRRTLQNAIQTLVDIDPIDWTIEAPTSVYDHPVFALSHSRRWLDVISGLAALNVLEEARPLARAAHHAPDNPYFMLDAREIRAFSRYAEDLTSQLVGLVDSRRADWGEILLIGMARLSALNRSIESGRLVFLDTFPENSRTLDDANLDRRDEVWALMLSENRNELDASRRYFRNNLEASELAWERVEERSNRFLEISNAALNKKSMRVARGHLIPSRSAPYAVPITLERGSYSYSSVITRAQERERDYSRELFRMHRYRLLDQNCATALFETINDSFDGSVETSEHQLGGHIRSRRSLAFIPFVSDRQVKARYSVIATETIPSYRQLRLEAMRDQESSVRVAFRESNTFTSTAYEGSSADSFFVFFTDESTLLRPIFGVVNLTAALGQIALGIVTAPVDQGHNLFRGLRGAFVSLPELAFSNIRKGSNDWIPPDHRKISSRQDGENEVR